MEYEDIRRFTPIHLGPSFPRPEIVLFGEARKGPADSDDPEKGYVSVEVSYPKQTDVLEFEVRGTPICRSYVPENVPELNNLNLLFEAEQRAIAEARLLNSQIASRPNIDFFSVEGGPIVFVEKQEGQGYLIKNSNFLLQVLGFYSTFLRKSAVAMKQIDHRAAKQAIVGMCHDRKDETLPFQKRLALDERINEAFVTLAMQISQQNN